ncbi:SH3 domain-containing protein [Butyricicoccus faecihominis]|uniref:SH3 domain-containing protein n=1 Tax=Butyricicoccus faecihominis TaxID=1712515 RepID=UPI00247A1374|nr:SH3 domain-containing protein [Butyricicoccus faecihominis]MCQ5129939.1 SH3 domain-containing protein [Butyricicoccus faecihominis]
MNKNIVRLGAIALGTSLLVPTAFAANEALPTNEAESPAAYIAESNVANTDNSKFDFVVSENTDTADSSIEPRWLLTKKYEVTGSDVNVRSGAGTNYKIVGTLQRGDIIKVKSIDNGWAKFKYDGVYCYVSSDYIQEA